MESIKIRIGGDIVINNCFDLKLIDKSLLNLFKKDTYNILNLECPILKDSNNKKIVKTGPHLKGHGESTKNILDHLNIDLLTLANNHIKDYGQKGISDTVKFCEDNGYDYVGVGRGLKDSMSTFKFSYGKLKISIINVAENEWSSALSNDWGSHPFDIIENSRIIKNEKKGSDYVFLIFHGGHEYYDLPSPNLKKNMRYLVEQGADLVVCHHSHCVSGYELYKEKYIFYGIGNFLFTKASKNEEWYKGVVLDLELNSEKIIKAKPIFCLVNPDDYSIKVADDNNQKYFLRNFNILSSIIKNDKELNNRWNDFVEKKYIEYLSNWSPINHVRIELLRKILFKLRFFFLSKKAIALHLNLLRCESHNDISNHVLTKWIKNLK